KLRKYLEVQNIHMESWSPFMNAQILGDETLNQIGKEVNKSAAQVVIRWNMQHGVIVIPKSVTPQRIEENINVFDFELTDEQMEQIDSLNKDQRIGPDPATFEGH
ncbi:aldo/keto reductase, partial [Staphylococcus haemolyticus]